MTKVGVFGAGGRMGRTVCAAVAAEPALELVAAVDPYHAGIDLQQLGVSDTGLQVAGSADVLVDADAEVAVDFTVLAAARKNLEWCADHGVHAVVGTTGFTPRVLTALKDRFERSTANAVIAPNFSVGAVLMMHFATLAAPYFDSAEIIELHHDAKLDAPSGTAARTAALMAAASGREPPPIHSVRLPGLVAHQEVLLGDVGQTLSIRHDTISRESFMPGVLLAVRRVGSLPERVTIGLEQLLP